MKFFIVGCAKTGTTLVNRLFYAFDSVKVFLDQEHHLVNLVKMSDDQNTHIVCKRKMNHIFSNVLDRSQINRNLKLIRDNDIKIIYIRRNRTDTLSSNNKYVPPKRYDACEKQAKEYSDDIDFIIQYEDLLEDCDGIQTKIAQKFGLHIKHLWSEYPKFIPEKAIKQLRLKGARYSYRPIGSSY